MEWSNRTFSWKIGHFFALIFYWPTLLTASYLACSLFTSCSSTMLAIGSVWHSAFDVPWCCFNFLSVFKFISGSVWYSAFDVLGSWSCFNSLSVLTGDLPSGSVWDSASYRSEVKRGIQWYKLYKFKQAQINPVLSDLSKCQRLAVRLVHRSYCHHHYHLFIINIITIVTVIILTSHCNYPQDDQLATISVLAHSLRL